MGVFGLDLSGGRRGWHPTDGVQTPSLSQALERTLGAVCLGCFNNTRDQAAYKQQSKTKMPADAVSGEGPPPGSYMVIFRVSYMVIFRVSSHTGRVEGNLGGLCYKGTDSIHQGPTLRT